MNEICKCPTCKAPIDRCPYCRDYKPIDNKFCQECFEMWSAEMEEVKKQFLKMEADVNDKYNYEKPKSPLEELKDRLKEVLDPEST